MTELTLNAPDRAAVARPSDELSKLLPAIMEALSDAEQRRRFAASMADPARVREYEIGYRQGRIDGFNQAMRRWQDDLAELWAIIRSVVDPMLVAALLREAAMIYTAPDGTPLPASTVRVLEGALWVHKLRALKPVLDALDREGLFGFAALTAVETARAMREAGVKWIRQFYALTATPRAQGHHAGVFIGQAHGEVLRAAVEAVAAEGAGRLLTGTGAADRLDILAERKLARKGVQRPVHLDDTVKELQRQVRQLDNVPSGPVLGQLRRLSEAEELGASVLRRLGSQAPEVMRQLDAADWAELLAKVRTLNPSRDGDHFILKGHLSELLYRRLPEFEALKRELTALVAHTTHWRKEVEFTRAVMGIAPDRSGRMIQLTDGLLVVFADKPLSGQPKVLILTVFESKSRTKWRELIGFRRKKGQPRPWAGQFSQDFERLSELPTVINGVTYQPHEVEVSRRYTRYVAVTAKDVNITEGQLEKLSDLQGFNAVSWKLPVFDRELTRVAYALLSTIP